MRVIPLYTRPLDPLASHAVVAPGGFERWELQAVDAAQGLRVVVAFVLGDLSIAEYGRQYRRFLRNPTRVSPPLPAKFPTINCSIYRNEKMVAVASMPISPAQATASVTAFDVRFGASRCWREGHGTIYLNVSLPGTAVPQLDLTFRPYGPAYSAQGSGRFRVAQDPHEQHTHFSGTGRVAYAFGTAPARGAQQ